MISGLHVQYYFVCKRKLWLYAKGIRLEEDYDRVIEGKLLHEQSYKQAEDRELFIDQSFKVDVLEKEFVREIKVSSKMTEADRYQLLYYLYQLKKRGVLRKGLVSYTKERKTEVIELTEKDEKELDRIEGEIIQLISRPTPPPFQKKTYCRKCAYYEFCFSDEEEMGDE